MKSFQSKDTLIRESTRKISLIEPCLDGVTRVNLYITDGKVDCIITRFFYKERFENIERNRLMRNGYVILDK